MTTTVSTPAALAKGLATPGALCTLDPAVDWGDIILQDIANEVGAGVPLPMLDAGNVAIRSLILRNSSGVKIRGGVFHAAVDHQLMVQGCRHVQVLGGEHANAVRSAISINSTTDFAVGNNIITACQNDGIDLGGCARGAVFHNRITGTVRTGQNHADGIQLWAEVGFPVEDLVIEHNFIQGETMGIGLHHSPPGAINGARGIIVRDNRIDISLSNALDFTDCESSRTARNVATTIPGGVTITGKPSAPVAMRFHGGSWTHSGDTCDGVPVLLPI